jgi:hypothetical protein
MFRQFRPIEAANGQKWLSILIDAMEQAASPDIRAVPCDRSALAAVRLQLEQPPLAYMPGASRFSFRN